MPDCEISFEESDKPAVRLPAGANLSEKLSAQNSPILFGCRLGICGTCMIEVLKGAESLAPPVGIELEYLSAFADPKRNFRLACQVNLTADVVIRRATDP